MQNNYQFNFIITVHNKEALIEEVILGALKCSSEESCVCLVVDGCTDSTEAIIDRVIIEHSGRKIFKVLADDVHELIAINVGLNSVTQTGNGFNIILQDDVVLEDLEIEGKVSGLYMWAGPNLGIVSFRHGANLSRPLLKKKEPVLPLDQYIENINGHSKNQSYTDLLYIGEFTYREIAIKSPICVPFYLIRDIGLPDVRFAPWDDIDYCYQALLKGYRNGVLAIKYQSEVEWGSMRTKKQKVSHEVIVKKNVQLFKDKHKVYLKKDNAIFSPVIYSAIYGDTYTPVKRRISFTNRIIRFLRAVKRYFRNG